jgi:3'-phosphoadenosine 5'-phosphosulfate sulfotransferase (PAPS reductase)/FAD synthetase
MTTQSTNKVAEPIHIISLGAGVQSSTMALMAAKGEITPMPVAAIFADTQAEPASVYKWLDWLEKQLPFPVQRVTRGSLETEALRVRLSKGGNNYTKHNIPAFMHGQKIGLMRRQCTGDFKIDIIKRAIRRLIGRKRDAKCIQWIGISMDEAHRMKDARPSYLQNRWPLIELKMTRADCLAWISRNGLPTPPRSSCVFCPYHSDKEWLRLKIEEPDEFSRAAEFEVKYQAAFSRLKEIEGIPFLHRSGCLLSTIDFAPERSGPDLFGNECEGMCGV